MNWIINVWCMLLLTSISGTLALGIWKVCTRHMEKKKKLRLIYPMQGVVEIFFLLPLIYICLEMWRHSGKGDTLISWLFGETIQIRIACRFFMATWVLGVIFQLVNYACRLWKMKGMLQKSCIEAEKGVSRIAEKVGRNLKLYRKVSVYRSYMVSSPMVTGTFRKQIILPVQEYSEKEMKIIFCHEMLHLKQGALLRKNAGALIRIIHWMNPVVYMLMEELDEWGETACDLAVRYQTNYISDFKMYYQMILENIKEQSGIPDMMTQFNKMKGIEKRVMRIKNYKREKDFRVISSVAVMMLFLFGCTTSVLAAGVGFEKAYNTIFERTIIEVEETYQMPKELVEYEEEWNPSEENVTTIQNDEWARGGNTINWNIPKNSTYQTSGFTLKKGQNIEVSIGVTPSDKTVKMGIITPDSKQRYVFVTGSQAHTFEITQAGTYHVFVQNNNAASVSIIGYYYN